MNVTLEKKIPFEHNGTKETEVYTLTGLKVYTLNRNDFHILLKVLTQTKMPVNIDNIVTRQNGNICSGGVRSTKLQSPTLLEGR